MHSSFFTGRDYLGFVICCKFTLFSPHVTVLFVRSDHHQINFLASISIVPCFYLFSGNLFQQFAQYGLYVFPQACRRNTDASMFSFRCFMDVNRKVLPLGDEHHLLIVGVEVLLSFWCNKPIIFTAPSCDNEDFLELSQYICYNSLGHTPWSIPSSID